jgi:hypothetical protein
MLRVTRRWWLLASLSAPFAAALSAEVLLLRLESANLIRISAPSLQFLSGKALERLKYGGSVSYLGQLSVSTDANRTVQARAISRFALSYDIWEERFSATRFSLLRGEEVARKASNLTESAVQSWCLDNLAIDVSQFPLDKDLWFRLEIRVEDNHDGAGVIGEPGISISRLIDLFSRPARPSQDRWQRDAGPVRLIDVKDVKDVKDAKSADVKHGV